uniref:2-methoxy-6-polyprenyl-1,4-benzoquinol methylase, mitochondrial n=1 Tax=Chromera velia CCMP2878 TaxID=1169474 RepID=A0A0G4GU51_9ALVE|eukprot:Cvel_23376.t1-p1 / transcript=Cvel_23376.t1 / gene=Cvel_23376 / organism=Chromera_velia_CCMP2878 / gene_product=2-methoxy-6-polyprenyl-1,4-benzoquinol methylase,, putative / transcript_product=2-methoxy-6-polyprenyl-1,4-benzoquinol methylase,, putative / location=Cvel_scaffold2401:24780-28663(+) / protein_length=346 / sequence_SO=supercontig / SO=protein_coding / is_pseudo=false
MASKKQGGGNGEETGDKTEPSTPSSSHDSSSSSQGSPSSSASASASSSPSSVSFGFREVSENVKESLVKGVFSSVASKYDLMNDLMSLGIHRLWKDQFIRQIDLHPSLSGEGRGSLKVVDIAGGTGDIAFRLLEDFESKKRGMKGETGHAEKGGEETEAAGTKEGEETGAEKAGPSLTVTVVDINESMLEMGKKRAGETEELKKFAPSLEWKCGSGEALPFEDNSVDLVTISFGIRNFTHIDKGLAEFFRILKPGGRFFCLEFSKVENETLRTVYDQYSFNVIPELGHVVANDRESYQYLVESIRKFPSQNDFAQMIWDAGFRHVRYSNMTFGVVAIHSGFKPPAA